jgi:tRNA(Ile)-lysidine synthase
MKTMLEKVRKALRKYSMVAPGEKVLVAVSGGADSMALLYSLYWLRKEFDISLAIAHLDHGIRQDTAEDLRIVRSAAEDLGLEMVYDRVDAPALAKREKLNLEEAARRLRRDFLLRASQDLGAQKIALGHTRTDLAETVLLHLLRGAGPAGLRGFLPVSPPFIRPLIFLSREETRDFCRAHGIPFRDDPTNLDRKILRNAIRLELLPWLKRHNPRAEEALARAAQLLGETEEVLAWLAEKTLSELEKDRGLDLRELRKLPKPVQALAVRALAQRYGVALYHRHVEAILEGIERGRAAEYRLPQGLVARIGGGLFLIEEVKAVPPGPWPLELPGETLIPELGWKIKTEKVPRPESLHPGSPNVAYVSSQKLRPPLYVRPAKKDDVFIPFGAERGKKVWEFLARQGIPRWERERWPLLLDSRGVVWVVGIRASGEYSVDAGENEVWRLEAYRL